ncbi:branched-chain amino acid ABC transporter permease [Georgenia daeguensis]|uniref:Branched-chain amino acid ABC transporter permease n=1 Tax=Georgenia daeguensis TaxID=908355 RepID=A0ABP8EVD0_9MICO
MTTRAPETRSVRGLTYRIQPPAPTRVRPAPARGLREPRRFMSAVGAVLLLLALALPFINASPYVISIGTSAFIYIMLAMGLNIVVGYAGLLDLGYYAFFAVGAYTSGVLATNEMPLVLTIPFVVVACIGAGLIIGGPTLRLRSDYLAIVTLGFGEIIRLTANNLELTGGPSGISGIPTFSFLGWSFRDGLDLFGIHFNGKILLYYTAVIAGGAFTVLAVSRLGRGRLGRAWRAIKDDEDAAEAMGINTYLAKLAAYVMGAIFGGLAGILMAAHQTAISPTSFVFLNSALLLMAVVLGGMGSTPGVIIGALVISLAPELLRDFSSWRYLVFGVLLVLMMLFRPQGLWPSTAVLPFLRFRARGRSPREGFTDHGEPSENVDRSEELA